MPARPELRIRGHLHQQREPLLGSRIAPNVKPHRIERGLEHANLSLGCYYFRALQSFEQSGADQRTEKADDRQHDKQFEKGEAIRAARLVLFSALHRPGRTAGASTVEHC